MYGYFFLDIRKPILWLYSAILTLFIITYFHPQLANHAVYSLHKTSTRDHILKKAKEWGVECEVVAELRVSCHNVLCSLYLQTTSDRFV